MGYAIPVVTRHSLMHTAQVAQMPWDDADDWEDGLWSLRYLQRFLLRCWHPFKNTESAGDMLVRQWLILLRNCTMSLFRPELVGSRVVWLSGTSRGAGRKSARVSTQIPKSISSKFFFFFFVFFCYASPNVWFRNIYPIFYILPIRPESRV